MSGRLVLVATPIGNLGDLSPRAVQALEEADKIACEDTRRTGKLLSHAGLSGRGRMLVVNEHTEPAEAANIAQLVCEGATVALVTDAGTPGISDPGRRVVAAVVERGCEVEAVPGPSAALAALVVSGLPSGRFCFEGFLPRKGSARSERLAALAAEQRTMVLFEAPHRLARSLADLAEVLGADRNLVVVREQTKLHEEVWRGTLGEAAARVARSQPKGEHVLVLAGAPAAAPPSVEVVRAALEEQLRAGLSRRDAVAAVAEQLAVAKRSVYQLSLDL